MLSPIEDFWLRWHSEHSVLEVAEQARLVLEAESGGSPGQVAANLGLSTQTVEGVLAKFEHDGLNTFPRPSLKLTQLIQLDSVDAAGRQYVARQAKRLFNNTRPLHHLPRKARQLLEAAAWLSSTAAPTNGNGTAKRGLYLLDGANLADYSAPEQAIISCVLHLQRKGNRADRDPIYPRLHPAEQSQVRHLAALLQVATALNHSRTQSTNLLTADLEDEAVVLRLTGPKADDDGHCACRQDTLWQPVFHLGLQYTQGPAPKPGLETPQAIRQTDRDKTVGEVFGQQMTAALRKWEASLPGAESTDMAGLADWLAGATEAEAALGAFASVLKRQPVKQVRRPLRALTKLLYAAVEQHNALSDLLVYCSGRPPAIVAELEPLREAWERSSRRCQLALRAWQDGNDAPVLYAQLAEMAATAPMRRRKASRLRVAAPVLVDELYSEVAGREAMVIADRPETYRRYQRRLARLACALPALNSLASRGKAGAIEDAAEAADRLLADVVRLESHIERWLASTALNDAIAVFLDSWAEQQARRKAPQLFGAQAVLGYRQARRAQWSRLRGSLPTDWRPIRASKLRRRLDAILKRLERP